MLQRRGSRAAAGRRARQALLPFPGQALALVLLVAVLAAVGVSAPLVVASSAQGAWDQRAQRLSEVLGTTLFSSTGSPDGEGSQERLQAVPELDERVRATGHDVGLEPPELTTYSQGDLRAAAPGGDGAGVRVVSRPGYRELPLLAGQATEDGVVAPEEYLRSTGAQVGDVLVLSDPGDELTGRAPSDPVEVTLTGVYGDVREPPVPDLWQGISTFVRWQPDPSTGQLQPPRPAALLTSQETALGVERATGVDTALSWHFPASPDLLVPQARRTAQASDALRSRVLAPGQPVTDLVQELGFLAPQGRTALRGVLEDVDRTVALLSPPVRAVGVGGALAALVLVGAWAGGRARRREGELRALVARGLSPARGGAQAALEALLPTSAGLVLGGALGWAAVVVLGPSPRLPAEVVLPVAGVLVVAGALALVLVAVVSATAVARLGRVGQGPAAQLAGRVPWLAVLAAVTVVAAAPLVLRAVRGDGAGPAGEVGLLALVVPLLAVVVVAGTVVALLQRLAPRLAGPVRRLPVPASLALRRVLAGPAATRLVVVTTALALGLVTYAGALAGSTARTVTAKAAVAAGGDVVVDLPRGRDRPDVRAATAGVARAATLTGSDERVEVVPGGTEADVLVVEPDELADVVRWDETFADEPLGALLASLATGAGGVDGRVPVVAAGDLPAGPVDDVDGAVTIRLGGYQVPAQVVARAEAFPGQSSLRPLLVAPWDAYSAAVEAADRDPRATIARQVWARGDADEVVAALTAAGTGPTDPVGDVRTAAELAQRPELVAQTWSLGYLRAVALAAGALGLVGLGLHAAAQARRRTVAVLLLARMGLSRRATAGSAALETGLLAVVAAAVAVAVALPASALVLGLLDPVPDLPPDPLLAVPWGTVALVVAGVVAVGAAAGGLAARTASRASAGEVLRDAD